jgi:hypothetical protein
MSACADFQPHGPFTYKDCAARSGMVEVVRRRGDPVELVSRVECSRVQGVGDFCVWLTEVATATFIRRA